MEKPVATLSIDLDNLWSYLRAQGDSDWTTYPSFLDIALPRALECFGDDLRATFFIVGRDAESMKDGGLFAVVGASHHEIGNHSYDHAQDFHRAPAAAVTADIERAETAIKAATGVHPRGFRGPSFRLSEVILDVLIARGYTYDASTFPTCIGPLLRIYHFATSKLDHAGRERQKDLFGAVRDGLRPLRPFHWDLGTARLIEIPVTTMPLLRVPTHMTYINFIADHSKRLAERWFRASLKLCRIRGIAPSLLLHSTDFIGTDDADCPKFMPGMRRPSRDKIALMRRLLDVYRDEFNVIPLGEFANLAEGGETLPSISPRFDAPMRTASRHD